MRNHRTISTLILLVGLFCWPLSAYPDTNHADDCVILLHGLARTSKSMNKMEDALHKHGYWVVNYSYPSNKADIPSLAATHLPLAMDSCPADYRINFVTHSMGGILLRQYLSENDIENLGRTVMLGPPNKGSQVVDKMGKLPGFKWVNGEAGLQLGTGENSIPLKLGAANFDVGIIAGTRTINFILSTMLPNPDDGKVSVENTKLEGMSDHISVPASHPFLMRNKQVIQQTLYYLKHGNFKRESAEEFSLEPDPR